MFFAFLSVVLRSSEILYLSGDTLSKSTYHGISKRTVMDNDLEAIRAQRMAQLRQQNPQAAPSPAGSGDQGRNAEEQKKQEAEMRNAMLSQVLDQSARARLNTIALAKPEKARMIENMVIQMATRGQIGSRLSEDQFKSILSQVQDQTKTATTVKFDRRRAQLDDEDDDKY